ncbi:MAG TPA: class II fructose-bisphosphate aldolase [Phycicoccus sp.]|jgi:fructose-bisphosphate aldolase class II|nr:class II fructose-bisphosphate aldolase [Phycicoccus sp.]HQH06278.1 class II fructose-bisphosphate aldolase [Phycicoccus sp.]HQK30724.1 class II fructose-bisphosphate aldolase [Phycicoccus sp.]HQV90487.1 class II fructose-bisphosphate aldolase [Phycicoccus sp.]
MTLTTTGAIVDAAAAARQAAAAFNVVTLEQVEGVIAGAQAVSVPAILQISENAVLFHGGAVRPLAAACRAAAEEASVPIALHFDHVTDLELVAQAAEAGFSSVMIDASTLPYADNVAVTARVTRELHAQGLWVEAELGEVGGKDGAHAPGVRTDPGDAAAFVDATGVDALAVAVGSSHAMRERTATLDHDLIARLHAKLAVPLVLHGSSGVPPQELRAAIAAGMTKVNIGTLLGRSFTGALREALAAGPRIIDPRKVLRPAREAVAKAVEGCLRDLGLGE